MSRLESLPNVGNGSAEPTVSDRADRRKRARIRVRWRIVLSRNILGEEAVETITEDLSSDGFYCFSKIPFAAGEMLFCTIHIPIADAGYGASHLECRVRVVRVEKGSADDKYGIACLTEDYEVVGCNGGFGSMCAVTSAGLFEKSGENRASHEIHFPSVR